MCCRESATENSGFIFVSVSHDKKTRLSSVANAKVRKGSKNGVADLPSFFCDKLRRRVTVSDNGRVCLMNLGPVGRPVFRPRGT